MPENPTNETAIEQFRGLFGLPQGAENQELNIGAGHQEVAIEQFAPVKSNPFDNPLFENTALKETMEQAGLTGALSRSLPPSKLTPDDEYTITRNALALIEDPVKNILSRIDEKTSGIKEAQSDFMGSEGLDIPEGLDIIGTSSDKQTFSDLLDPFHTNLNVSKIVGPAATAIGFLSGNQKIGDFGRLVGPALSGNLPQTISSAAKFAGKKFDIPYAGDIAKLATMLATQKNDPQDVLAQGAKSVAQHAFGIPVSGLLDVAFKGTESTGQPGKTGSTAAAARNVGSIIGKVAGLTGPASLVLSGALGALGTLYAWSELDRGWKDEYGGQKLVSLPEALITNIPFLGWVLQLFGFNSLSGQMAGVVADMLHIADVEAQLEARTKAKDFMKHYPDPPSFGNPKGPEGADELDALPPDEGEDELDDTLPNGETDDSGDDESGDTFCWVAGTKILMGDYSHKNIEDLEIGDVVMSFPEDNKVRRWTTVLQPKPIISLQVSRNSNIWYLNDSMVSGTEWMIKGDGTATLVMWLNEGDELMDYNGKKIKIHTIRPAQEDLSKQITYTFETQNNYTYIADGMRTIRGRAVRAPESFNFKESVITAGSMQDEYNRKFGTHKLAA